MARRQRKIPRRNGRPTADASQRKLAQVLDGARSQFSSRGYRATTIRSVALAAQVSTRTLYNRFGDKLSLFKACLESGAEAAFPVLEARTGERAEHVLLRFAVQVVQALSSDSSLQLGMLVYREGAEFPELLRAAEENQQRHLLAPLAAYLRELGLEQREREESARLFLAMCLSEWQRRIAFRRPAPRQEEVQSHAQRVVGTFLAGAAVGCAPRR